MCESNSIDCVGFVLVGASRQLLKQILVFWCCLVASILEVQAFWSASSSSQSNSCTKIRRTHEASQPQQQQLQQQLQQQHELEQQQQQLKHV